MKTLKKYYEDLVLSPEANSFCMLKPGFAQYKTEFENLLKLKGWKVTNHCTKRFTRPEIEDFYSMHKEKPFYNKLCDYMTTDDCECYACYKRTKDPYGEMNDFKKKIRDEWGEDDMRNGMHSSDCKDNMLKECAIAFNKINEAKDSKVTYGEFFELLEKYLDKKKKELQLYQFINDDLRELPELEFDNPTKDIYIKALGKDDNYLVCHVGSKGNKKWAQYTTALSIDVKALKNTPVDFINDEWINVIKTFLENYK